MLGLEAVEIGVGGYSRSSHLNTEELLGSSLKIDEFKDKLKKRNMFLSASGIHGNPVHPNKSIAEAHHADFERTVLVTEKLGVDTVLVLSGCPGGSPEDMTPNWVTCPWPEDFSKILDYQWNEVRTEG